MTQAGGVTDFGQGRSIGDVDVEGVTGFGQRDRSFADVDVDTRRWVRNISATEDSKAKQ